MRRRSFIKSLLSALGALFAPEFVSRKADATISLMPFLSSCGTDDWAARSAGALLASRLDTQAAIDAYAFPGGSDPRLWVLDPSIKSGCSAGSAKFVVANTDAAASGESIIPYGQVFGQGSTHWVSYRIRQPATHLFQTWPAAGGTGSKQIILAKPSASQQSFSVVISDHHNRGELDGYHYHDGSAILPWETSRDTGCTASDVIFEPEIDNGLNPLIGVNPDSGAAWTACEQDGARYGGVYTRNNSTNFPTTRTGIGDWLSGAFRSVPDKWMTVTIRVIVGTWDTASSRITVWAAPDLQPYVRVFDTNNVTLGAVGDDGFSAAFLLPYATNRVPGGRQISSRTNNIGGVSLYTCGLSTPIGTGVLEYNASVQRFRWHGTGEAFGPAAGFSVANGKVLRNIISGGATDSYIVAEVTNAAALPPSGVVTDNVVIADGRPDTQVNYADFILSLNPINAPGGNTGGYIPSVLPSWRPPAGFFADIPTLNVPQDVFAPAFYPTEWQPLFVNWTGGAILRDYSALGAMAIHGAGHENSYAEANKQGVLTLDFSTLLWAYHNAPTQINTPGTAPPPNDFNNINASGEFADGSIYAAHTYMGLQEMPTAWGGGPKGTLVCLGNFDSGTRAGGTVGTSHKMDVSQATLGYSVLTVGAGAGIYALSARDDVRQGWWLFGANQTPIGQLRFISKTGSVGPARSTAFGSHDSEPGMAYWPARDVVILLPGKYHEGDYRSAGVDTVYVYDATNDVEYSVPTSGKPPSLNTGYFNPTPQEMATITVVAGGAGYVVNDTITFNSPDGSGSFPQNYPKITVTAVSSGAITAVSFFNRPLTGYTLEQRGWLQSASPPSNPISQLSTSGAGTGATFNATWQAAKDKFRPQNCGFTWCQPLGCIVGFDEIYSEIVTLTPPATNIFTSAWTWARVSIAHWTAGDPSGQTTLNRGQNSPLGKLQYVDSLRALVMFNCVGVLGDLTYHKPQIITLPGM